MLLRVAVRFLGIGIGITITIPIPIPIPMTAIKPNGKGEHHYHRDKKAKNDKYNCHFLTSPKGYNRPTACTDYEANVLLHSIVGSRHMTDYY
jgi:hypothetical protein